MPGRMKVEDRCYKSKAVLDYDLFMPQRTAVTILSPCFFFFFHFFSLPGEAKESFGVGWAIPVLQKQPVSCTLFINKLSDLSRNQPCVEEKSWEGMEDKVGMRGRGTASCVEKWGGELMKG